MLAGIACLGLLSGTADAQSGPLDRLLKGTRLGGNSGSAIHASATPTAAQRETMRAKLAQAAGPAVRADMAAAAPLIEATIVAVACATDATAFRALNGRRLIPHNYGTPDDTLYYAAMGGMRYHDRTTCVDLARIAAATKPALNALQLTLNFVSASSGESKVQKVSFRRVGDEWLLDQLDASEPRMP